MRISTIKYRTANTPNSVAERWQSKLRCLSILVIQQSPRDIPVDQVFAPCSECTRPSVFYAEFTANQDNLIGFLII